MKKIIGIFLVCLIGLPAFAEMKMGVVDIRKAISTVTAGKAAMEKIKKEFKAKEKEFQAKEKKLLDMKKNIEKKAVALSDDQKRAKAMEFQQKMVAFQNEVRKSQEAIALRERELTAPILQELEKQIAVLAKEKGLAMVFQKAEQNIVYVDKKHDYTDSLVEKFNASYKAKK